VESVPKTKRNATVGRIQRAVSRQTGTKPLPWQTRPRQPVPGEATQSIPREASSGLRRRPGRSLRRRKATHAVLGLDVHGTATRRTGMPAAVRLVNASAYRPLSAALTTRKSLASLKIWPRLLIAVGLFPSADGGGVLFVLKWWLVLGIGNTDSVVG